MFITLDAPYLYAMFITLDAPYPYAMFITLDAPYLYAMFITLDASYLYAMFITLDASTPYDMLVTLYFSSLPYLYAKSPISVCQVSHICMPSLPYLYAKSPISVCHYVRKLLSFMAFCHWKIFKTLKIYENGFYAREVLAAAFLGKKQIRVKKGPPLP